MKKTKSKKEAFKPQILRPMYPFRDGGIRIIIKPGAEAANISQYFLDEEACSILKSKAPEAVKKSDGKTTIDLGLLKGILIKDCNVRPPDILDIDWPTILSLLTQREHTAAETNKRPRVQQAVKNVLEERPYLRKPKLSHEDTEELVMRVNRLLKSWNQGPVTKQVVLNAKSKIVRGKKQEKEITDIVTFKI